MQPQPNMQQMLQQVAQMQQQMEQAQRELEQEEIEVSAGGGTVKVVITGGLEVRSVTIDPQLIDTDERELLQDTVTAATNEAIRKAQARAEEALGGATGGLDLGALGLGGMPGLPGGGGAPGGGTPGGGGGPAGGGPTGFGF